MNPDEARAARNRANAAHSTGPKTEAGKKRSSLNAYRHGLTGHTIILPVEDLDAYHTFTRKFFVEFKPQSMLENQLVQSLADTAWRMNRVPALENNLIALGFAEHENKIVTEHPQIHAALVIIHALREQIQAFNALSMHSQRLSRQFHNIVKQLRQVQAERRAHENKPVTTRGFVFSKPSDVRPISAPRADVPASLPRPDVPKPSESTSPEVK
ncbi:MAG: hypothetical protein M3O35_11650 [Acidobacteriota bacterium]|nr:hypothetical protein [Acidobacteriota bacterium]